MPFEVMSHTSPTPEIEKKSDITEANDALVTAKAELTTHQQELTALQEKLSRLEKDAAVEQSRPEADRDIVYTIQLRIEQELVAGDITQKQQEIDAKTKEVNDKVIALVKTVTDNPVSFPTELPALLQKEHYANIEREVLGIIGSPEAAQHYLSVIPHTPEKLTKLRELGKAMMEFKAHQQRVQRS